MDPGRAEQPLRHDVAPTMLGLPNSVTECDKTAVNVTASGVTMIRKAHMNVPLRGTFQDAARVTVGDPVCSEVGGAAGRGRLSVDLSDRFDPDHLRVSEAFRGITDEVAE